MEPAGPTDRKNRMEVEEDLDMKVLDVVDLTDDDRMSIDPVEEPVVCGCHVFFCRFC